MPVPTQPTSAPHPHPTDTTTNDGDSVRRSSRLSSSNTAARNAQASQTSNSKAPKRRASLAESNDKCKRQTDIRDLFRGPAWYGSDDDYEPFPKRQKLGANSGDNGASTRDTNSKASLKVTLTLPPKSRTQFQAITRSPIIVATKPSTSLTKPNSQSIRKSNAQEEILDNRPLPWGHPQVWADTRAELADALPYFNAYQGAAAMVGGKVKGMLLDEDRGQRSHIDEEVVITRAGGGVGTDESTGKAVQMKDQDSSHFRVLSFRNNMIKKIPLQLIIGSKNVQCPSQIPFRYCVMGSFHITYIWAEKSNRCTVYRFRMQKVDLRRKSWWAAEDSKSTPETQRISKVKAVEKVCDICHETWKQVYKQGWICFTVTCASFWKLPGTHPADASLEFSEEFLAERAECPEVEAPYPIIPQLVKYDDAGARLEKTLSVTKQCWKGIVCENCGRCLQRRDWDAWKCPALGCGFQYAPPRQIIPASAVMGDLDHAFQGHAISDDKWDEKLTTCEVKTHGFFKVHDYVLPHDGIKITHLHSNGPINAKAGGADDIFRRLQQANIGLQRLPLKMGPVSGLVSAHFSKNFGLPYEYVVDHPELSTSFADAPAEIREAVRRLLWAGKRAIADDEELTINECLAVGYFQGQSMGYHDDGEDCLGPHVMAWSLGGPATMKFRMKWKYYSGFNKERKTYHPDFPVLPGCYKPEERLKLNSIAKTMSREEVSIRAREMLKGCPSKAPVFLEMKLRHGDFMSMHGAQMQVYYEHEVQSNHELRFGLTGRFVKPEMVAKDQRWKGDIHLDPTTAYDGEFQVYQDWKEDQEAVRDQASMRRSSSSSAATLA